MTQVAPIPSAAGPHFVLSDVSWRFYQSLLDEVGDQPVRVTYHKGRIELMAPLSEHEVWKKAIGQMIQMICIELDLPMRMLGSTTFRRQDRQAGLEPDECYYLQSAAALRDKKHIDLMVDPPPDLAVEIDITHRWIPRQPVYADLGVPELWRFDGSRLSVLVLVSGQRYEERPTSLAFPFLPMDEFRRHLDAAGSVDDTTAMRAFQKWVRTLSPP